MGIGLGPNRISPGLLAAVVRHYRPLQANARWGELLLQCYYYYFYTYFYFYFYYYNCYCYYYYWVILVDLDQVHQVQGQFSYQIL